MKTIPISLKLKFTPNTVGCYGLTSLCCANVWRRKKSSGETAFPEAPIKSASLSIFSVFCGFYDSYDMQDPIQSALRLEITK